MTVQSSRLSSVLPNTNQTAHSSGLSSDTASPVACFQPLGADIAHSEIYVDFDYPCRRMHYGFDRWTSISSITNIWPDLTLSALSEEHYAVRPTHWDVIRPISLRRYDDLYEDHVRNG